VVSVRARAHHGPTHIVGGTDGRIRQLSTIRLPRRNVLLARHGQVDRIHHDRVSRLRLPVGSLRRLAAGIAVAEQTLVVCRVVLFVEPGGETKV
jgi:hypothetical protein